MRSIVLIVMVLLALDRPAPDGAAASAPAHAWSCVSNERSGDMTLLDAETRSTVATIPLGQRPRGIHASPDGRFLYVALSGSPIGGPGADGARAAAADRDADGI